MGDGKRLKEIIDEKGTNIRKVAKAAGITPSTLYAIIQKDTKGYLDTMRVKGYLKYSLMPLMKLYGKNGMPDVDRLLTNFYKLDDEARQEIISSINIKLQYHTDSDRANDVKNIKGW